MARAPSEGYEFKRPVVSTTQAVQLSRQLFGLEARIVKELQSYGDRNFYLRGIRCTKATAVAVEESEYVLKILNYADSDQEFVDSQNSLAMFLKEQGFDCPTPVQATNGDFKVMWLNVAPHSGSEEKVLEAVRLLNFVPGRLLSDVPITERLLRDTGKTLAKLNRLARDYSDPMLESRAYDWDLQNLENIRRYIVRSDEKDNDDDVTVELLNFVYERFIHEVLPRLSVLDKQIIHNDFNDTNILVTSSRPGGYAVSGILDFGDICFSYRLFDVAICIAHMMMAMCESGKAWSHATRIAGHVVCGYQATFPLSASELDLVYWSTAARICQVVALGRHRSSLEPDNVRVKSGLRTGVNLLQYYVGIPKEDMMNMWLAQSSDGTT